MIEVRAFVLPSSSRSRTEALVRGRRRDDALRIMSQRADEQSGDIL